jgi:hypothetical protein
MGLAFFGEQGGERLHKKFAHLELNSRSVQGEGNKLRNTLKAHLTQVAPEFF